MFPFEFKNILLRDILHYTNEEIENLSLREEMMSLIYSIQVYRRRDIVHAFQLAFGGQDKKTKGKGKGNFDFKIKHPLIEDYIKKMNEEKGPEIGSDYK